FSSRRRHTRFKCDWSSDVCSSDLDPGHGDGDGDGADHPVLADALAEPQCADKPAGYTSDLGRRFTFGHWVVTLSDYPGTSGPQDRRRAATNGPIGCCSGSFDTS